MERILHFLKNPVNEHIGLVEYDKLRIKEIIEKLQSKGCNNCIYDNDSLSDTLNYCCNCSRNHKDLWQNK